MGNGCFVWVAISLWIHMYIIVQSSVIADDLWHGLVLIYGMV